MITLLANIIITPRTFTSIRDVLIVPENVPKTRISQPRPVHGDGKPKGISNIVNQYDKNKYRKLCPNQPHLMECKYID